jgi:hypothetical protein
MDPWYAKFLVWAILAMPQLTGVILRLLWWSELGGTRPWSCKRWTGKKYLKDIALFLCHDAYPMMCLLEPI